MFHPCNLMVQMAVLYKLLLKDEQMSYYKQNIQQQLIFVLLGRLYVVLKKYPNVFQNLFIYFNIIYKTISLFFIYTMLN